MYMYLARSLHTLLLSNHYHLNLFPVPSLHDALPIYESGGVPRAQERSTVRANQKGLRVTGGVIDVPIDRRDDSCPERDRKSTRLNSSHLVISYAVFCLKKKIKKREN